MARVSSQYHIPRRAVPRSSPFYTKTSSSRPSVAFARTPQHPYASRPTGRANRDGTPNYNSKDDIFDEGDGEADEDTESDHSTFHWEEEDTLIEDLMDEQHDNSDDENLDTLAGSLQSVFTDRGKELKREIAQRLVPTHNHVRAIHNVVDTRIKVSYGKGVAMLNKACLATEGTICIQQDEIGQAHRAKQAEKERIIEELQELYTARSELWDKCFASLEAIWNSVIEGIKDTPAKVEHTITKLEQQAKVLEKNNSGKTALDIEKILKAVGA